MEDPFDLYSPKNSPYPPVETIDTEKTTNISKYLILFITTTI